MTRAAKTIKNIFRTRKGRSFGGNAALIIGLSLMAVMFLFPVVFIANNAFKPLNEVLKVPPDVFVRNPTLQNFYALGSIFANSLVPFWRYFFNTGLIVVVGTLGQIIFASMAAYPLAKYDFAGNDFISSVIVLSLMFSTAVTAVPNYLIMSWLHLTDTYLAVILPAFSSTLGLYLMKNFMSQVPSSLIEAANIDGAGEFGTLWRVVMPAVKPAWITLFILSFQTMWGATGGNMIYKENLKPLSASLGQIATGATVSLTGVVNAVSFLMFLIPVVIFIFMQSNVIETMTTSGMKE